MPFTNVPRTLRVAAVLTLTVVLLIASASCQRDRVVAPVVAPSVARQDVAPATNPESVQLHYLCANRFRARNRNDFDVYAQWIVIGTSDSGAIALPARPAGAPYSETFFDVPDSGTVRLFVTGVHIASATSAQRACKTRGLALRMDDGVVVTSPALDSSYPAGTSVPYSFAAAPGYTHLLVALDDTLVPASGTVVMSRSHMLWAAADVDVTLPAPTNPLVMELKGLLTAADPVAAYQQLLDDVGTIFDAVGPDEASRQVTLAGLAAYDVLRDSAALIRVDNALAQHVFTLGSGEYDGSGSGGGVISVSDKTPSGVAGVGRSSDVATGLCAPQRAPVALPSAEPTRIVYVNGIRTTPDEAVDAELRLGCALRASGQFAKSKFRLDHFYNRTWSVQFREDVRQNIWCALAAASWHGYWSQLTQAAYFTGCATQAAVIALRTNDYVEAATEFSQVENNSSSTTEDAVAFAAYLDGHRSADGEHLIIVAHSQGNLITQQAVQRLRDSALFAPKSDSLCVGVVAVAAPTSANWPLDKSLLLGLQVPGDLLVSITRANHFPPVSTPLSDSLAAVVAEFHSEMANTSDADER